MRMSYKAGYKIEGFFEYVVPPLEGFWWQDGIKGVDYSSKSSFNWISAIRLPDFVTDLSDPRKCKPENMKTVIRHPVRKLQGMM